MIKEDARSLDPKPYTRAYYGGYLSFLRAILEVQTIAHMAWQSSLIRLLPSNTSAATPLKSLMV